MKDFRRLIRYIFPYWINALFNILFNILGSVFDLFSISLIIPFLGILFNSQELVTTHVPLSFTTESITNNFYYLLSSIIIQQGTTRALISICIMVVVSSLLKNLFNFLASYNMAPTINGVVKDIQDELYKKILILPLSYFNEERKGNVMSRFSNDVQDIKFSIMSSLEMIFRDPIKIILYLVALIMMSPRLTLIVIVLLPLSGYIIGTTARKLRSRGRHAKDIYGEIMSTVEETITGLRVIKAFNVEERATRNFTKQNGLYNNLLVRISRMQSLASPLSEFLGTVVLILIMLYGGSLVLNKQAGISPQSLIGYLAIFSQIINPAKSFTTAWFNIQRGLSSMDRIRVILDADIKIAEKEQPYPMSEFQSSIEYKNVSFKYERDEVLKNVNFSIKKGQTIALVGRSGSGKSTLVDLLPRFMDASDGKILIDGKSIKDYSLKDLRNHMGIVSQQSILFNDNFFNNIAFGVHSAKEEDVINAAKIANAHEFIIDTPQGYYSNIGEGGSKLSGGQRQRLSIARAVLKNPPILILDEATSALDTESERLVQDAIIKLMKNRTSIVIAHRLSTIKNADDIIVLDEGEIVERGRHDELLKQQGVYKYLHDMQMF